MLRRFSRFSVLVLFLFTFAGQAYGSWQEYDNPVMGEYLFFNGSISTQPDPVLEKFLVGPSVMSELINLPDFSQKKLSSGDAINVHTYNMPDIYKWVTRHEEHIEYLKTLMNTSSGKTRMNMKLLGEYPLGYPMALCVFTNSGSSTPPLEPDEVRALGKPVVWLQGPIHGGEQDAYSGLQYIMWKLATGQWDHYLEKVSVVVLPRINADGAKNMTRGSTIRPDKVIYYSNPADKPNSSKFMNHSIATNIDMNRDNLWLDMQSLRALHTAWNSYAPELAADHHQMGMTHNYGENGFLASMDVSGNPVMQSGRVALWVSRDIAGNPILDASGNLINLNTARATTYYRTTDITTQHGDHLNNPLRLRQYFINKMEPFIKSFLNSKNVGHDLYVIGTSGFRGGGSSLNPEAYAPYYPDGTNPDGTGVKWNGYLEGAEFDPVHMFNAIPLKPCLSILIESASSTSSSIRYPKRVFSQMTTAEALIKFGADNAAEVKELIADVRNAIATAGKTYDPSDMVINTMWYRDTPIKLRSFTAYDSSGKLVDLKINLYSTRDGVAKVQYPRPVAYILKKNKTNTDIVKRLTFNGATVEILNDDAVIDVEAYRNLRKSPWHHPVTNLMMAGTPDLAGTYSDKSKYLYDAKLAPWTPPFMTVSDGLQNESVQFRKGDYVIYMDTYAARIIATALEADAERSFTRWSMALKEYSDPTAEVCVPYRYVANTRLNTSRAHVILPEALNAFIEDIHFISGPELEELNASSFPGQALRFAEDLQIQRGSGTVSLKFPKALMDQGLEGSGWYLYDWTESSFVEQDADYAASTLSGGLPIASQYISGQGVIRIAAVAGSGDYDDGGSSGCNSVAGLLVIFLALPVLLRKRR